MLQPHRITLMFVSHPEVLSVEDLGKHLQGVCAHKTTHFDCSKEVTEETAVEGLLHLVGKEMELEEGTDVTELHGMLTKAYEMHPSGFHIMLWALADDEVTLSICGPDAIGLPRELQQ